MQPENVLLQTFILVINGLRLRFVSLNWHMTPYQLHDWLFDWLIDWLIDLFIYWLIDWLIDWLILRSWHLAGKQKSCWYSLFLMILTIAMDISKALKLLTFWHLGFSNICCLQCFDSVCWGNGNCIWSIKTFASKPLGMTVEVSGWVQPEVPYGWVQMVLVCLVRIRMIIDWALVLSN